MMNTRFLRMALLLLLSGQPGCVELLILLGGEFPASENGTMPPPGNGEPPPDGSSDGRPVVRLTASNLSPTAQEEVVLTCEAFAGDSTNLVFDFSSSTQRLIVDQTLGTARFIVSDSDIGTEFSLTCTAMSSEGTSAPSNQVVVIPVGDLEPVDAGGGG